VKIPQTVSGRTVTNRGVHLQPFGFHDTFMDSADYWLDLLVSMGMSWVLALSASDAFYKSGAAKALLDAGIIPIVRMAYTLPDPWVELESVEQLANLYARYDAPCIIQFANEPFDEREWRNKHVPPEDEAWSIIDRRFNEMAQAVTARGAIAGFPDGPCYADNPFVRTAASEWAWYEEKAVYLGHHYGKGRPLNYPYDDVNQNGTPITRAEYEAALDDYAGDPNWNEALVNPNILFMINEQRRLWARPGLTAGEDDTCFNGWQRIAWFSQTAFGFQAPLMMTEGGWVPRDRAGSNPTDIRWPMTTPRMVAQKTLAMYEADTPLLAICPWLLACKELGGSGWEFDSWVGGAYADKYGYEKPVVQTLKDNPPKPNVGGLERVQAILAESLQLLKGVG